jgi:hypothetical protein
MAKRSAPRRTIVVRSVASRLRPIIVRAPAAVKKFHHRRGSGKSKSGEKHRMGAIAGGAVLGLLDKSGFAIPTLPFLGKAGTAGLAAWAVGKWTNSPWADDMATGMLSIAAYELAKEGHIDGDVDGYVAGV